MKALTRLTALLLMCLLAAGVMLPTAASAAASPIDNSKLIPAIVPDSQVQYVNNSPDWAKDLILAQFRIETATEEGTLEAAVRVLDHYAEMGVNGLMILPVADRPLDADGNGYNNRGPDTIWSKITGTTDYEAGWAKFKTFVDEAHKRNLRVIVDIITWGIAVDSTAYREHPEWFNRSSYENAGYRYANCNWTRAGIADYWADCLVRVAKATGLDGYRCDCEPFTSGYTMYGIVRDRVYAELDRKLLIMSETVGGRNDPAGYPVYDLEQWGGVTYHDRTENGWGNKLMASANTTFTEHYNIVDAIKTKGNPAIYNDGRDSLYVNMMSCHDYNHPVAEGNRVYMGYQAIFAPFIPMWFIGEEWNNPYKAGGTGVLYFNKIDWEKLEVAANRAYFEDLKAMIRVRRQYPEVFTHFPESVRDANICKVTTSRDGELQAYARWQGDTAVLVVPNTDNVLSKRKFTVTVPWKDMGMDAAAKGDYLLIDGMTGKQIQKGTRAELTQFVATVASEAVGVFVIRPAAASTTKPTTTATSATNPSGSVTGTVPTESADATDPGDTTAPSADGTDATTAGPTGTNPTTAVDVPGDPETPAVPVALVIGIAAGAAVIVAAVVVLLLFKKRKNV